MYTTPKKTHQTFSTSSLSAKQDCLTNFSTKITITPKQYTKQWKDLLKEEVTDLFEAVSKNKRRKFYGEDFHVISN